MITPNGGVFGRNPKFNTVSTQGAVTVGTTATVAGNITLTNGNVVVASGKGIDFSATAGTGTSELFADYEEGTWSPVFSPATGSFTTLTMDIVAATYTKVGRQVTVTTYIRTDNVDATGASGALRVSGLPFTSGADNYSNAIVGLALVWNVNHPRAGYIGPSETIITLTTRTAANGTDANVQVSALTTGATANQNITYLTATYFT